MPETQNHEQVVMTPKCKTPNSTTLLIERRVIEKTSDKMHVAGGEHTGIVINKEVVNGKSFFLMDMFNFILYTEFFMILENGVDSPPQLSLEFRVFLVSSQTGKHTQESRTLRFWFRSLNTINGFSDTDNAAVAQDFFRELVSPQEFPRGNRRKHCNAESNELNCIIFRLCWLHKENYEAHAAQLRVDFKNRD